MEDLQAPAGRRQIRAGLQRFVNTHGHEIRQTVDRPVFCPAPDIMGLPAVTPSPAVRAGDVHIRQKLHIQRDLSGPVAGGAAEFTCIVGKISRFIAACLCVRRPGIDLAQIIVHIGIGCHCGPHIDTDGGRVDQLDLMDARCLQRSYVGGKFLSIDGGGKSRNQALQDHGRLAGTGDAGDHCQLPFRDPDIQGMHGVDGTGLHMDGSLCKKPRFPA